MPPRFGSRIPYHFLNDKKRYFNTTAEKRSNFPEDIPVKGDRSECAMCKKYSRGPCGNHFTKWLDCIDANSGNESNCDDLVLTLDRCLKKNQEYYDKINAYDDEGEDLDQSKWNDFISDLESDQEEAIPIESFPPDKVPDIQIRLEKKLGVIQFHPKMERKKSEHSLVLGYVKDQNGTVLAGASADELVSNDGMYLLRFHTSNDTKDVVVCAIYMDTNEDEKNSVIIYRRVERLPV